VGEGGRREREREREREGGGILELGTYYFNVPRGAADREIGNDRHSNVTTLYHMHYCCYHSATGDMV
jgi:hypothetical protein